MRCRRECIRIGAFRRGEPTWFADSHRAFVHVLACTCGECPAFRQMSHVNSEIAYPGNTCRIEKLRSRQNERVFDARVPMRKVESRESCCEHALGLLMEGFARQTRYVPENACAVHSSEELPPAIARAAAGRTGTVWRAWTDGARFWCVSGRAACAESATGDAILELVFIGSDGSAEAAGAWSLNAQGRWTLCRADERPLSSRSYAKPLPFPDMWEDVRCGDRSRSRSAVSPL